MQVYMGLKGLSDYFKGSLIILNFELNLFVFSELTKITVKEPNDFFFFLGHKQQPQHSNVMFYCEIYGSVLLKPHI